MGPMPQRAAVGEGSWDDLFDLLDPERPGNEGTDRDRIAEAKLRDIRRRLTSFFAGRGCRGEADDLATETILRVASKSREIADAVAADPTAYFYGVARNVFHEWVRGSARDTRAIAALNADPTLRLSPDPETWEDQEAAHRCLERCLTTLTPRARQLIRAYYREERTAKIEHHRRLADEFGKSVNALRIEVHRIRKGLCRCVFGCLDPTMAELEC